jgi:hypothetical protein
VEETPVHWLDKWFPSGVHDSVGTTGEVVLLGSLAVIVLIILLAVLRALAGGKRPTAHREEGLEENLAEYPPPPRPGPRQLVVDGTPARVRLVVIAPVGKTAKIDAGKAEALLEHVLRGLGGVVQHDKPRVRIWAPQLSHQGFAVSFQRLTHKPEPEGRASRWALLAGQARVGERYILLGLALLSDEKTSIGRLTLEPDQWTEMLRIKSS